MAKILLRPTTMKMRIKIKELSIILDVTAVSPTAACRRECTHGTACSRVCTFFLSCLRTVSAQNTEENLLRAAQLDAYFFIKKIARYSYSKISSSKRRVDLKQIICDFGLASQRVDILSNTISPLAFSIVRKDFIALADYFVRMLECINTPVHASFFFFFLFIHTLHTCKRMYVWEYLGNARWHVQRQGLNTLFETGHVLRLQMVLYYGMLCWIAWASCGLFLRPISLRLSLALRIGSFNIGKCS